MSKGRRTRPVMQEETAMTMREARGWGLSERSIPEVAAARGVVRDGEMMVVVDISGRARRASRSERMKESVVRRRME